MPRTKSAFNPEQFAELLLGGGEGSLNSLSNAQLLAIMQVLVEWTKQAHRRAKSAEEELAESPNWKMRHKYLQDSLESKNKDLQGVVQERDDARADLVKVNKELNEGKRTIELLQKKLDAALASRNAQGTLVASVTRAAIADIELASLVGVTFLRDDSSEG